MTKGLPLGREAKNALNGIYHAVTFADARELRDQARKLLAQGINPNAKKQAEVKVLKEKCDNIRSSKTVAIAWLSTKEKWSKDYQNTLCSEA